MNRNHFTKIAITVSVLILPLLTFGCQAEQNTPTAPTPQEDEMTNPEAQPQNGITVISVDEITNITWQWVAWIETEPAAQSVVADPENYTLTFWDDGSLSFKADCNNGGGTYIVNGNQIEFGPLMSTMALCPPESLHDPFIALLNNIDTFGMAGEKLVFSLKADAGEIRFTNAGPAAAPESPAAAPEATAPEIKTLYIGPEKVDCVGVGPMECYQVKADPNSEWELFYDQIEGLQWEPGYTYELSVAVHQVENPPADGSSLRYELIEVVHQVETPVVAANSTAYIKIEQPAAGTILDASQPIQISGRGAGLFEGNVVVQIVDAAGNELTLQPTALQSPEAGMGGEGPWETEISLKIEAETTGKIIAFSPSPKEGEGWIASDEVAVTFNLGTAVEASLENTPWVLRSFAQQEEINALLAVHQATALFNAADGTISGTTGCNRYFSSYTQDGNQLTLENPIATTRMACTEPKAALESAVLAALEMVASFEINGTDLIFQDAEGNPLLVFEVDPYTLSQAFTREELANTSYLSEFTETGIVQLTHGIYQAPAAEDSATELTVMLTDYAAFGDISGDQAEDAVVVLITQAGGSGSFYDLTVVRKQGEALTNMARIQLGDRVQIKNLTIENGIIVVEMVTHGPDDPMCCPTQRLINNYVLENGELTLAQSEITE